MTNPPNNGANPSAKPSAIVIGAGWSGLYSAKTLLGLGYNVTVLEARSSVGGVWNVEKDIVEVPRIVTASTFTELTSSRSVTQAHDFPYTEDMSDFPTSAQIFEYLKSYQETHNINVRYETWVTRIDQTSDKDQGSTKWAVYAKKGKIYHCDRLVVAVGIQSNSKTNQELSRIFQNFIGEQYNYQDFLRSNDFEKLRGKRVLVIGGGESASEILLHICRVVEGSAGWSTRGFHGFRKRGVQISPTVQAYDNIDVVYHANTTGLFRFGKIGLRNVCALCSSGNLLFPQGHAVQSFERRGRWGTQFFTKNTEAVFAVGKEITALPEVQYTKGNMIAFSDGSTSEYDAVILCVGGTYSPPSFAKDLPLPKDCFKYVLSMEDPSLAYIGMVRPTVGSFPLMSEYSLSVLEEFWKPDTELPSTITLQKAHNKFSKLVDIFFDGHRPARLPTLIDPYLYWAATRAQYGSSRNNNNNNIKRGNYDSLTERLTSVPTYLVPFLACCLLDDLIHILSALLPTFLRRLLGGPNLDRALYITKNDECRETVDYWREQGYRVHEVDPKFEREHKEYAPMLKTAVTLFGMLSLEVALWWFSSAYRAAALSRIAMYLTQLLHWQYQLWTLL